MNQAMKNKAFISEYLNFLSGKVKTEAMLAHYISDQKLIEHILFFDGAFPKYEALIDEMIAEDNKVMVRARLIGKHEGVFGDIPPSHRSVDFPFVVTYTIEDNKIISHWLVADQMILLEQLGVEPALAAH
jgi:predicted ester cyclase